MIYSSSQPATSLKQGEIVSSLPQIVLSAESFYSQKEKDLKVHRRMHPLAIVLTQDCDLERDFRERKQDEPKPEKLLPSVLFCEVQTAEELFSGRDINSKIWARIKINKDERYQFLNGIAPEEDAQGEGLPELGIDFKRYFTVPTDELYSRFEQETKRRCFLNPPYSQHLIFRFFYFQSRIGLPEDHASEP
jgi:hypothetical protein